MPRPLLLALLAGLVAAMWTASIVTRRMQAVAEAVLPPPTRSFERLTLLTVGSGGTFESPLRLGPCLAVGRGEDVALVDVGRGVAEGLRQAALPAGQPRALLLTSLLPENLVGLDDWLAARALDVAPAPLRVWGPPGSAALVGELARAGAPARGALAASFGLPAPAEPEVEEVAEAGDWQLGALRLRARSLPGGPLPALAWRIEDDAHSLVVSGAGWAPDAVDELGRGADLLVHEAVYGASLERALAAGVENGEALRAEATRHLRLEDAGTLASRMGVRGLVLVRLRPPPAFEIQYRWLVRREFRGRVIVARDGEAVTP
jgi:ribonuclease BN (tRNA processing enzyme)